MVIAAIFFIALLLNICGNLLTGNPMFGSFEAHLAQLSQPSSSYFIPFEDSTNVVTGFVNAIFTAGGIAAAGVVFGIQFIKDLFNILYWPQNNTLMSHPIMVLFKIPFWALSVWATLQAGAIFFRRG